MTVLLLLPDGVGIRNFLLAPLVEQLSADDAVHALHVIPDALLPTYQALDGADRVQWHPFLPYRETPVVATLRYALSYGQMYWAKTDAMRFTLGLASRGSLRNRTMHRLSRSIGRVLASPRGIRLLANRHAAAVERLPEVRHYVELLQRIRPDVLFCSHQRPPIVIPAVIAARSLGIPTATFIFSWDNLSGKGRIPAPFDHYLVWSEHMRQEFNRFYPDVDRSRVHVVGTPQFDFYADPSLTWTREAFFARIGADPARPLICYSGGDPSNSPEDAEHVRILMNQIRNGQVRREAQVLLRPAPVDGGARFDAVRRDFPELLYARPDWVHTGKSNWDQILPMPPDVEFLANLTRHADVNINLGSTMSLDFAIHDRPVVNVAFDVATPPPFGGPIWDHHYRFEHYQPVIELGAAKFARSAGQMAAYVEAYLDDPSLDREGRRQLVTLQLGPPPGDSTRHVIAALRRIAGVARPGPVAEAAATRFDAV